MSEEGRSPFPALMPKDAAGTFLGHIGDGGVFRLVLFIFGLNPTDFLGRGLALPSATPT